MTSPVSRIIAEIRTPTGFTLTMTAGIGLPLVAHWYPLLALMLPLYVVTLFAPTLARDSRLWFAVAAISAVAVTVQRAHMEDHVFLWVAWTLAIAIALLDHPTFLQELGRHGRLLIGCAFGVATLWKLLSSSFLSGAALWTLGLHDDRLRPLLAITGISQDSLDQAQPAVGQVAEGQLASFDISLSSYSSVALVALSFATIAMEALVAIVYLASNESRLARLRVPTLFIFGLVTYSIVPVLPFAALLVLITLVLVDFDRRASIALGLMLIISLARFFML